MTTKKIVRKKTEEATVSVADQDKNEGKAVKMGFTTAVLEDGELVFNVHGNPGIVELQGLVAFAVKVAEAKFKDQLSIDDVAILKELRQLSTQVQNLQTKVDSIEVVEQNEVET